MPFRISAAEIWRYVPCEPEMESGSNPLGSRGILTLINESLSVPAWPTVNTSVPAWTAERSMAKEDGHTIDHYIPL